MGLKGIDVSSARGTVDWEKAKAAGLNFAILRCGFGDDIVKQDDVQFARNVVECDRLGIPWGAYLYSYAMTVEGVKSEISHVLRLLRGKEPTFPVLIDIENDNYKAQRGGLPKVQALTDIVKTFCTAIQAAGYVAGWYTYKDIYTGHIYPDQLKDWVFWYSRPAIAKPDFPCQMWQNQIGETGGKWPGVNGTCDLDISYVDYANTGKEVPEELKIVVVPFGLKDIGAAETLATFLHGRVAAEDDIQPGEQIYQVGGPIKDGRTVISGADFSDTAEKVCEFIRDYGKGGK